METFLHFFLSNLVSIIQWTVALVLVLLGVLFVLILKSRSKDGGVATSEASGIDLKSIENSLKEIVKSGMANASSSSNEKPVNPTNVTTAAKPATGNQASFEKMMQELALKDAEIQNLKSKVDEQEQALEQAKDNFEGSHGSSESGVNVDLAPYLEKIQHLEGRLAEYEIIEDDIADLSKYKEENEKLKREIEELMKGVSPSKVSSEQSHETESKAEESEVQVDPELGETLVAEFAAAVDEPEPPVEEVEINSDIFKDALAEMEAELSGSQDSEAEVKASDESNIAEEIDTKIDEKEESVEVDLKSSDVEEAVETNNDLVESETVVEATPTDEKTEPQVKKEKHDDILAEFAKSVDDSEASTNHSFIEESEEDFSMSSNGQSVKEDVTSGSVDTDKMLEEIGDLQSIDMKGAVGSSLEENVDTDLMAEEASKLSGSDS